VISDELQNPWKTPWCHGDLMMKNYHNIHEYIYIYPWYITVILPEITM
jgi:hypothetical protein